MLGVQGKDLIFISKIKRDGSGVVKRFDKKYLDNDEWYDISSLSLSQGTYIASGFNSYVVRLKPERLIRTKYSQK
jgi:hypothetical protein